MRNYHMFILLIIGHCLSAQQLQFNFESGNLNNWQQSDTGRWEIDSINPISGNKSLHHSYDSPVSGFDMIALQHDVLFFDSTTTTWEFKVVYDYNPSSGNNWSYWLAADKGVSGMHPSGTTNGYVIGINYTGSDDLLKVWHQEGGNSSAIFSSGFNWQNSVSPGDSVAIKVSRTVQGRWSLDVNLLKNDSWQNLGAFNETSLVSSEYTGVYYEYSSTQDRKLWIDDISVEGLFYADTFAPAIDSYDILERNQLNIQFSEEIDTSKAINFTLNSGLQPGKIQWLNRAEVELTFDEIFLEENILEISGVVDLKGNQASILKLIFTYYEAQLYDVIITEILADPTPSAGLPEEEFIEIINRSPYPLNMEGWKLYSGSKSVTFPELILYPQVYYILTRNIDKWPKIVDSLIIEMAALPALTNDGALLQLFDKNNTFISGVEYSAEMYTTERKQEGGWSLELIDIEKFCLQQFNWRECEGINGGTPGVKNSISDEIENFPLPEVERIYVIDSTKISLKFNLTMDSSSVIQIESYTITEGVQIDSIWCNPPFFNEVILSLAEPLHENKLYECRVHRNISNCLGTEAAETVLGFGLPKTPEPGNVVINEILFDTTYQVPEYIELYNNSESVIELRNCAVEFIDDDTSSILKSILVSSDYLQLMPGEYIVITKNREQLVKHFNTCNPDKVLEPEKWQALNNEGGKLAIIDFASNHIDEAIFSADMHFSLLFETGGVSLEKIHPDKNGLAESSWHSAAADANYGTPTLKNSQYAEGNPEGVNYFEFHTTEISPNNDGENDVLSIAYNFPKSGYLVSVIIFNRSGHLVNELVNNELFGIHGSVTWDGLSGRGTQLPMGYYIIYIEAVHPEGHVIQEKKAVLVIPQK